MEKDKPLDILAVIFDIKLTLENSAVFQSQVGEQIRALQSFGFQVGLLAVSKDNALFDRVIGRSLREAGLSIYLVREGGFWGNIARMVRALRRIRRQREIRHAYVRGLWGPLLLALAHPLRRIRHVYDVRGDIGDEMRAVGTGALKRLLYLGLEGRGIRSADGVSAVTGFLAENVAKRFRKSGVEVIPCNVDVETFRIPEEVIGERRRSLGIRPGEIVLAYSGGLSHYQQIPAMLQLWRRLLDEPDLRFLLLTNDNPHSKPLVVGEVGDFGARLQFQSVPREEVVIMLSVASVGFMLRDSRELNNAASPVKFAEYLASGLAVVASPGTGDVSRHVEEYGVGILVDPADLDGGERKVRALLGNIRSGSGDFRARAKSLASSKYDWSAYRDAYRRLYGAPMHGGGR